MRDSTMVFQDEVHDRPEVVVRIAGGEGLRLYEPLVGRIEAWAKDCIAERNVLGS